MNQNIANIFKSCRKFNKLQQTEMAKTLNVTQGTISKVEAASMGIELELWFKFLEVFKIRDPYCFYYNSFELVNLNSRSIVSDGSALIPSFKFTDNFIFLEVKILRPLIDLIQYKHLNELNNFLKKNNIKMEIFYILNHPIPVEIAKSFFQFLESLKINTKTLLLLNLEFSSTFGESLESGRNLDLNEVIDIFNRANNILYYKVLNKNEYTVTLNSSEFVVSEILLIEYFLMLPFLFLRSRNGPNLKVLKKESNKLNNWIVGFQ